MNRRIRYYGFRCLSSGEAWAWMSVGHCVLALECAMLGYLYMWLIGDYILGMG